MPLSKSSKLQLWPILCQFCKSDVFVVGVFSGMSKPNSVDFLEDLVQELHTIELEGGISYCGKSIPITLRAIVADSPARAFMKCIKEHSGYSSCERCTIKGIYNMNRVTFTDNKVYPPRKTQQFNKLEYVSEASDDHQKFLSPLVRINNFSCINNIPLDYMHLCFLGKT